MNETRRKVSYKEFETTQEGYCLLITGGMMSPPIAIIERHDGTLTEIPIEKIQFLDSDAFMQNRRVDARQLALKTRVCPMCEDCPDGCPVETPKDSRNIVTNADRIRSMSDKELAEYIFDLGNGSEYCYGHCAYQDDCPTELDHDTCIKGVIEWLKQPAKEE